MNGSVGRLVRLAEGLGMPEDWLDVAVRDCCQEEMLGELNATGDPGEQEGIIASGEAEAGGINNSGVEARIAYLLEGNDEKAVEGLIRDCAEGE